MTLIKRFAEHPIAANLLMIMMIVAGIWGARQLNTQFLPPFEFKMVTVQVVWPGASPEDIERNITLPLEQELRNVDFLDEMKSTSVYGMSTINLEFDYSTNISTVLDQIKEKVSQVDTLPVDSEPPVIMEQIFYEQIATILVSGFLELGEGRRLIRNLEQSLLDAGIAKVEIRGLPEEEIAIQVPSQHLYEIKKPLNQIGENILQQSQDAPAGTAGRNVVARQLRTEEQRREAQPFDELIVSVDEQGRMIQLGEIATVKRRPKLDETLIFKKDVPTVEMKVMRISNSDALTNARILEEWVADTKPTLPQGVDITVIDERWTYISDRLNLLLENGFSGLILVVLILYVFLNSRVAFWVAAGIPTVFLGTLFLMAIVGESINMLSLFALIMVLGVIVDDAIVVGEEALSEYEKGYPPLEACTNAAIRMRAPIISSSLTTIAAFMPLLLLTDLLGEVLMTIPLIVIIVLLCSLFEAFYILPGHLYHSLKKPYKKQPRWREKVEVRFNHLKSRYHEFLDKTLRNRAMTYSAGLSVFVIAIGLVLGGRVPFTFFPSPEAGTMTGYVQFVAGTPPDRVHYFLTEMEKALYEAEDSFGEKLIIDSVVYQNLSFSENTGRNDRGSEFGTIFVELTKPDERDVRNPELIQRWMSFIPDVAYIETINVESPKTGPPGLDIDVQLSGANAETLKTAALELREEIGRYMGVYNIEDDLPFGRTQWIIELTPQGRTVGLTVQDIAAQVRAAYEGFIVQTFYVHEDEVEVKIMLPDNERHNFTRFDTLPIITPAGQAIPLSNVASIRSKVGMQALRHTDTRLAVHVTAEVDTTQANTNRILASLAENYLPTLQQKYGLVWSFEGTAADEEHTLAEMETGALIGFIMIYLILCAILGSYLWPLVVLAAIPFGLAGAIFGHFILDMDFTLLSLFGLFGLAGIVINDSIILLLAYFRHRKDGLTIHDASIQAGRDRLRAVLLTSLTTIGGLTPLLFETSLQAQFLIPMATSLVFGLAFSTVMVLIIIPNLIATTESIKQNHPRQLVKLRRFVKRMKYLMLKRFETYGAKHD